MLKYAPPTFKELSAPLCISSVRQKPLVSSSKIGNEREKLMKSRQRQWTYQPQLLSYFTAEVIFLIKESWFVPPKQCYVSNAILVYSKDRNVNTVHWSAFTILCVQCTLYSVPYTIYIIQYTIQVFAGKRMRNTYFKIIASSKIQYIIAIAVIVCILYILYGLSKSSVTDSSV